MTPHRELDLRPWESCAHGVVSLLEMLRFYADKFTFHLTAVSACEAKLCLEEENTQVVKLAAAQVYAKLCELQRIYESCEIKSSAAQCKRITEKLKNRQMIVRCGELRADLQQLRERHDDEMRDHFFLHLDEREAEQYQNPLKNWEAILKKFPDAQDDVEEMNCCLALNRYSAAVFHILLVVEHGLIDLGNFIGVNDKKPGWDATSKALDKILGAGRTPTTPRKIRKHFAFLELVNKDMQSMKMAWRNKVSHADNHLFLMTSDFKPEVADKIINACHGFMLLMATEGPLAK